MHEDGIAFGPGLSTPDAADLWTHDATGRLTTWIEVRHRHRRAAAQVACSTTRARRRTSSLDDERAAAALKAELAEERWPRACPPPILWTIDAALVAALAEREERRQRWAVTIVGDHFYIDIDGRTLNGAVVRG